MDNDLLISVLRAHTFIAWKMILLWFQSNMYFFIAAKLRKFAETTLSNNKRNWV